MALTRPERNMVWSKRTMLLDSEVKERFNKTFCMDGAHLPFSASAEKTEAQAECLKKQWKEFQAFIATTDAPEIPE